MNLTCIPLFDELHASQNVLIAGAGGGFDILSGLPLYFALRNQGKNVFLANLSFSNLSEATGTRLSPAALLVNADSTGANRYFPEKYLCEWFRTRGENIEICCFHLVGAIPVTIGYTRICEQWQIDTIILVDGGTDILMRGDEVGLGTPQEDIVSIAAVDEVDVSQAFVVCTAFGVDRFHGINHFQYLEAVAALSKTGDFLGVFSYLKEMEEVCLYQEAYTFVEERMRFSSIVSTSIISAVNGEYGDYHATFRTQGSTLWINPLMNMYWGFRLAGVAKRCLYLDELKHTTRYHEINEVIRRFRTTHQPIKEWESIPA
ncbi:MAG: hypothetical protein B6244_12395 [Candidatus Cloacimonetes bacterium 4572_55]|nr:MAG: hypothetical protein B6244_12395 [Candidatus Cloacimonetes bacterium 4572_55]